MWTRRRGQIRNEERRISGRGGEDGGWEDEGRWIQNWRRRWVVWDEGRGR